MDPEVYGRSPLEAASFIVSSAFPDPKVRGPAWVTLSRHAVPSYAVP